MRYRYVINSPTRYATKEDAESAIQSDDSHVVRTSYVHNPYMIGRNVRVGDYLNYHGYTDVTPYVVVGMTASGKTATIRRIEANLDPDWKPEFLVGGYVGHCVNNREQKYVYGDPVGPEIKVRLGKYGWGRGLYVPSENPVKFHDYNF